jgi:hypothetical protein
LSINWFATTSLLLPFIKIHKPWNVVIVQAIALERERKMECNGIAAKIAGKRNKSIIPDPAFWKTSSCGLEA